MDRPPLMKNRGSHLTCCPLDLGESFLLTLVPLTLQTYKSFLKRIIHSRLPSAIRSQGGKDGHSCMTLVRHLQWRNPALRAKCLQGLSILLNIHSALHTRYSVYASPLNMHAAPCKWFVKRGEGDLRSRTLHRMHCYPTIFQTLDCRGV